MKTTVSAIALVLTLAPLPVAAQGHSHSHEGQHGGQVTDAGGFHVEAVARGDTLTIHLTDHDSGKPVSTNGFKGIAILAVGGKSQRIALAPAGSNTLAGKAPSGLSAPIKGAVQITDAGNMTVQAKF